MVEGVDQPIPYSEMVIWIVLEGRGTIACDGLSEPVQFGTGDTVLLPAGLKAGRVKTLDNCLWLEVFVPVASSLSGYDHPRREGLGAAPQRFVPLNVAPRDKNE